MAGNGAEVENLSTQQGQEKGATGTKGVVAGLRRPAGTEEIGEWQVIPNMVRWGSSEYGIDPRMGNDAER